MFSDLTADEFKGSYTGLNRDNRSPKGEENGTIFLAEKTEVEDEVDWRKKGAVTPVKFQGENFNSFYNSFLKINFLSLVSPRQVNAIGKKPCRMNLSF